MQPVVALPASISCLTGSRKPESNSHLKGDENVWRCLMFVNRANQNLSFFRYKKDRVPLNE